MPAPTAGQHTERKKALLSFYEPVPRAGSGNGFDFGSKLKVIEFHFNPKEYSTSLQADWKVEAKKGAVEVPEYTGCKPMSMTVELFLDGTEAREKRPDGPPPTPKVKVGDAITTLIESVRPAPGSDDHPCPPLCLFSWSSGPSFPCVVKSVAVSVTMFTPEAQPLRASCKLTLLEYTAENPPQNPSSGADRSVKARAVGLGDTLASIAHEELGNPAQWRAIAVTNGIEDPFSLVVGSELLIPARADVPELV